MQSRRSQMFHALSSSALRCSRVGCNVLERDFKRRGRRSSHASLFSLFELSSSRLLELEIGQYDQARARSRTGFIPWRAELKHRNRARHELELLKISNEPIPNNHYSLRIGSFPPLVAAVCFVESIYLLE
jgi:hypothetical protein